MFGLEIRTKVLTDLIPKGESGKTEGCVVLDVDPGCRIYAGLKSDTTAEDLRGLTPKTTDDHLASFKPEVGQGVLIKAGTVHSLGRRSDCVRGAGEQPSRSDLVRPLTSRSPTLARSASLGVLLCQPLCAGSSQSAIASMFPRQHEP